MSNLDPQTEAKAQAKAQKAYAKAARPWHKKKRTWLLGGFAVIVAVAMFSGGGDAGTTADADSNSSSQTQTEEPKATPMAVTAAQMLKDLEGNALKAKSTYQDKYVKITGKVYNIDASGDYFSVDGVNDEFTITGIMMNIGEEHLAQVQEFQVGDKVTVIGTVTDVGEILGYSVDVESIV